MKKAILPLILAFLIAPGPVLTPAEEAPAGETPPTSGITPPPEPGMFEGVLPPEATKDAPVKVKYFKIIWIPIGNGKILDSSEERLEIDGSGGIADKSAEIYLLIEDRGESKARVKFEASGQAQADQPFEVKIDEVTTYTKDGSTLTFTTPEVTIQQSNFPRACKFGNRLCSGPGIQVYAKRKTGEEHTVRFDLGQ